MLGFQKRSCWNTGWNETREMFINVCWWHRSWLKRVRVCVCLCVHCLLTQLCTRAHSALAARVLWNCCCCIHSLVDVVLGVEPSCLQVSVECFCWDVFGENVCWVFVCVNLIESHDVMWDQLLYEEMFQVNVFCFSWRSYPCCHALAAWRVCVNLDVDLLDVEELHEEVAQMKCFCCSCVDGV